MVDSQWPEKDHPCGHHGAAAAQWSEAVPGLVLDALESTVTKNQQLPRRYTPPMAAKVGDFGKDTDGTIYTKKDATTLGFKKPR